MTNGDIGSYIWRGDKKIELEKSQDTFTAILSKSSDIEKLKNKAKSVELVHGKIAELTVDPNERDKLMDEIRSEDKLVSHHQYIAKDSPSTKYTLTDKIVVKFKPELSEQEIAEIIEKSGLVIEKKYDPNTLILTVTSAAKANPVKVANKLIDSGKVEYAEPNVIIKYAKMYIPVDSLFKEQWHLSANPDIDIVEGADVSAPEAWELTRGKREIVVAVLDDGFDMDHPDFKGEGKIVSPKDYVDGDIRPFPVKEHEDYHGTPCAGVAVAEENGIGCTGAAPGCAFMPVRFDLNASDIELIDIFENISRNADIVSCSWGPTPGNYPLPTLLYNKIHEFAMHGGKRGKGLVIIFAAGNYDAPLNLDDTINGFASHPDVIAVAASTSLNTKALYSNWGKEISVAAPSNNFNPLDGQRLFGRGITTTDNEIHGLGFTAGSEYTSVFGGTSSATPLVAGIAGLVVSINPNLTAKEVKEILQMTGDKIIDPGQDSILGTRKGTYDATGFSEWFGYGKVNAYRAVLEALKMRDGLTTNLIQKNVSANLNIPDNNPAGIQSTLMISETGKIEDIRVKVNIKHTYIGDLVVTLISPHGEKAILHNRTGGRTDNINNSYTPFSVKDASTVKSLRSVLMKGGQGVWTLAVADMVRQDAGTLSSWGLEIKAISAGNNVIRKEIEPEDTLIPDNDSSGIVSSITIDIDRKIKDIKVWVDITHTWIGDLTIDLKSPAGSSVRLHDREGRSLDNITKTYTQQDTPQLSQFMGESAIGEWELKVTDLAAWDEGDLNRWGIEINLEP